MRNEVNVKLIIMLCCYDYLKNIFLFWVVLSVLVGCIDYNLVLVILVYFFCYCLVVI